MIKQVGKKVEMAFHHDKELEREITKNRLKKDFVKESIKKKKKEGTKLETNIVLDADAAKEFEIQDMGAGDESMAVKPYMGAIRKPTNHNPINRTVPDEIYAIEFVYGYKCEEAR
jgi:hypothetical protein